MKKLFLLISSLFYALNTIACWDPVYTQEDHKHFLIPNLFTTSCYRQSLIATTNNLYYDIDYNIYNWEKDQLINKLQQLGISKSTIDLMNKKNVKSVDLEGDLLNVLFEDNHKHSKIKIYDLTIDNFYPKDIVLEFKKVNQIELLNYLMYRHLVLFDSKYYLIDNQSINYWKSNYLSDNVKRKLRKRIIVEMEKCPNILRYDFAMLLIDMSLFSYKPKQVVEDYMNYLRNSKELNLVAYSHFAGSVVKMYDVTPTFEYMEYRDNNELSVYLFSKLFEYPKLYIKALSEISFVIDDKKDFDWEKCFSYCKTQEERDRINLAKVSIFSGVNISLFDYFKDRTTNDSKLFELALIQYIQRIEYNLFSPLYINGAFKENYKKNSEAVNKFVLADAIDLQNYIYKIDIDNKVLLHMLRGYLSFMLGDFTKAREQYTFTKRYLNSTNNLTQKEKKGYLYQLEGFLLLERYNRDFSKVTYDRLNKRLTELLQQNYKKEDLESYFELGMTQAVKENDFSTAFFYASNKGFHLKILLDIFMENDDLNKLLKIVEQNKLPFGDRHPKDLRYTILEQIGTNYFRNDNFNIAKKYFDKLPDSIFREGRLGKAYYQNSYWHENYYDFAVDYSKDNNEVLKKYNKKTALNRIIDLKSDIQLKEKKLNDLTNDSLLISKLRKEISNLFFELSCIYSSPFWAYSRFWSSRLHYGIYFSDDSPFNVLGLQFIRSKIDTFLIKYGNQYKSINYIKRAIFYEDNAEIQAQLHFKLYSKLKKPFHTSFHKRRYFNKYWADSEIWGMNYAQKLEFETINKDKMITALLIDSLYNKTNYFKEVISECSDFNRKKSQYKSINKVEERPKKVVKGGVNYKFFSLLLLIIVLGLFVYLRIK